MGNSTALQVVHIEYGKMIRTSQKGFVYTILVELFTAHLLKEKPRFYHFVKPRYMRHKECRNIFVTPGITIYMGNVNKVHVIILIFQKIPSKTTVTFRLKNILSSNG